MTQYALAKTGECPSARESASCQKYMKDNIHYDISSIWRENLFGYFFFGHYPLPQQLTVFLELRFWKTVGSSEQTVSAHKCPRISSKQMEAIFSYTSLWTFERVNSFLRTAANLKPVCEFLKVIQKSYLGLKSTKILYLLRG